MTAASTVRQAASLLLSYPERDWPARCALVEDALHPAVPGEPARLLADFCRATAAVPVLDLAARYVTTFDRSRRRTLHLTYYTDGDTRRRGASLVRLKSLYRAHGWEPAGGELPDFLPAVLEFAARCPEPGRALLVEHRPALELLHAALTKHTSPYADVVRAVLLTLPDPTSGDLSRVRHLAQAGPPSESVGL
ncbi:nitrate reductase molybdenum cofactor assembly chaperone [Streptomyces caatingaensis]|uniref:Nitrate reductase n=1 Tax=Streptomyces caatingaensis TaxID=1678637 RepID=A0A0K9X8N3_9ACTN|nr:nitrate reductase molybdenum cofactor assembly chaperone [Streptomyces caatingaensis]KNB49784.1 nitrate reductase [Streptomyces caatingaensis]